MDFVRLAKKHSALLLPIGITLAAIGLFVPTLLAGRAVRSQMQESISLSNQIRSFAGKTVPANQYKVEQAYQQEHAGDANAIRSLMLQTSERELLSYGLFPEPNKTETSSAIFTNFGKAYRKAVENIIAGMRAQDCPTEAEIAEITKSTSAGNRGDSVASGRNDVIIEQLCKDRAESIPVYANPAIFSGYDFWDNYNYVGRDEAVEDCWKTQLAYWIQKDLADTIAAMNKDSSSVLKSPIKRLIAISFSGTGLYGADAAGRQFSSAAPDMPRYVLSNTDGILTTPWTGRISGDDMDVIHFAFSVVLSNKAVEPFMKELCSQKPHIFKGWSGQDPSQQFIHNQITILKSAVEPVVHTSVSTMDKYRYGDDAVVQLTLVCEYIFNKAGYAKIKPRPSSEQPADAETASPPRSNSQSGKGRGAGRGSSPDRSE